MAKLDYYTVFNRILTQKLQEYQRAVEAKNKYWIAKARVSIVGLHQFMVDNNIDFNISEKETSLMNQALKPLEVKWTR